MAVVLDAEVAAAFPTSESVNAALRVVIGQRRAKRRLGVARRSNNNRMQRTSGAARKRSAARR